jgi:hypothetical protein
MLGLEVYDQVLTPEQCNEIIALFEHDDRKSPGIIGTNQLNPNVKQSTDLHASFNDSSFKQYNDLILPGLHRAFHKFKDTYTFLDYALPWSLTPDYNIQQYQDGQGYFTPHCEHTPYYPYRILAWMIYLNTATCGTEFPYQQITLNAIQGNVAIWSAAWTHPHKGVTPNVGMKYIATGWCEYTNDQ